MEHCNFGQCDMGCGAGAAKLLRARKYVSSRHHRKLSRVDFIAHAEDSKGFLFESWTRANTHKVSLVEQLTP
jgi:hypothetical protein